MLVLVGNILFTDIMIGLVSCTYTMNKKSTSFLYLGDRAGKYKALVGVGGLFVFPNLNLICNRQGDYHSHKYHYVFYGTHVSALRNIYCLLST